MSDPADLLELKIRQLFATSAERVRTELDALEGSERVKLAVLKLSDGDAEKLDEFIRAAKVDYRDVLAWAEYPEEMSLATWNMGETAVKDVRARDRQQYDEWLGQPAKVDD